ncbi:MAG: TAXI family TRAP transporter solute-binding subunit [Vicinamibacterales bacterium]
MRRLALRSEVRLRILAALTVAAVGCAPPAEAPRPRPVLRLSTGPQGGGFFPLGAELVARLSPRMPGVELRSVASAGAVDNVVAIQGAEADLGFTFADVAYIGFSGQLKPGQMFDRMRGVAVLQLTPISLVVRPDLHIRTPADLRGRTVGVGPPGSGTALTANLILRKYGLDADSVHLESIGFQEASTRLLRGTLDAMFDNAINQADSLRRAIEGGARPVAIEGTVVDELRREYPFLKLASVSAEMYPDLVTDVHTIGVDGVLICRRDLDQGIVYDLTRHLFETWRGADGRNALGALDVAEAAATPIPLHPGAARYYRERELSH